jgi:hypothetical protein
VNTRELNLEEFIEIVILFRSRFKTARLKFHRAIYDLDDESSSLEIAAAVGLNYEIIVTGLSDVGGGGGGGEEKRTNVIAVVKIYQGRIAQSDIVLDTLPLQMEVEEKKEIDCCIM